MKKVIWLVLLVLVAVGLYMTLKQEPETEMAEAATAAGAVVAVNLEGVALDGPALVTIEADGGEQTVIAVPSMGINLCAAREDIADVFSLEVGTSVSARGELDEEGRIVPCADASHYLRVE